MKAAATTQDSLRDEWSLLHDAIENNYMDILQLLIKHGADINVTATMQTGYQKVMSVLCVGDSTSKTPRRTKEHELVLVTPLVLAIYLEREDMISLLLEQNASFEAGNISPVCAAIKIGRESIIQMVISKASQTNLNTPTLSGMHHLHYDHHTEGNDTAKGFLLL
jgi:ankyrin repeat protein